MPFYLKHIVWIQFLLLAGLGLHDLEAQNLVPNGDFSEYKYCPGWRGLLGWAEPWYSPNRNTTDFCHVCADPTAYAGIPENRWGYQESYVGDGYIGLRTWISPEVFVAGKNYREYMAVALLDSLVAGEAYLLGFQLSIGDSAAYFSDDIGMYLSPDSIPDDSLLRVQPQLANPEGNMLTNLEEWVEISGTYIAKGGEKYLVIGNFKEDAQTTLQKRPNSEDLFQTTYYFIDDVRVEPCKSKIPDDLIVNKDSLICPGGQITLEAVNIDSANYEWNDGSTASMLEIDAAGLYHLKVDVAGCERTDSIQIGLAPSPIVDLGPDTIICDGDSLLLSIEDNADQYIWNDGSINPSLLVNSSGMYSITATIGMCEQRDSILITLESKPEDPEPIKLIKCEEESIELKAAIDGKEYIWQNASKLQDFTAEKSGLYWVDIFSSCYTLRQEFQVEEETCNCEVAVPTVFTPNGDGFNDIFKPKLTTGTSNYHMIVFDRWGKQLFESRDASQLWEGRYLDKQMPPGIYFWVLSYRCRENGQEVGKTLKGYLTLIR